MPAEPLKSQLYKTVDNLAQEFGTPLFDPHVTICTGGANAKEALAVATKTASQFHAVDLESTGLEQSAQFTKTFYVQFGNSEYAKKISDKMRKSFIVISDYVLNPHLSLLYKNMPETQRQELCRRSLIPFGRYRFDALCAVEFDAPWSGKYRILGTFSLKAA